MRPDIEKLSEQLNQEEDSFVLNLWYRYTQHLEIGYSHWRESFMDEVNAKGKSIEEVLDDKMRSKETTKEAELLKQHPTADANLLRLQQKYGLRSREW